MLTRFYRTPFGAILFTDPVEYSRILVNCLILLSLHSAHTFVMLAFYPVTLFVCYVIGKTYTTIGTVHHPGLAPRTLEYLFRTLGNLPKNNKIKPVAASVELLNDDAYYAEKEVKYQLLRLLPDTDVKTHTQTFRCVSICAITCFCNTLIVGPCRDV